MGVPYLQKYAYTICLDLEIKANYNRKSQDHHLHLPNHIFRNKYKYSQCVQINVCTIFKVQFSKI